LQVYFIDLLVVNYCKYKLISKLIQTEFIQLRVYFIDLLVVNYCIYIYISCPLSKKKYMLYPSFVGTTYLNNFMISNKAQLNY